MCWVIRGKECENCRVHFIGRSWQGFLLVDEPVFVADTFVVTMEFFEVGCFGNGVFTVRAAAEGIVVGRGAAVKANSLKEVPFGAITVERVRRKLRRVGLKRGRAVRCHRLFGG